MRIPTRGEPSVRTVLIIVICLAAYATGAVTARRLLAPRLSALAHPLEFVLVTAALFVIASLRSAHPGLTFFLLASAATFLLALLVAGVNGRIGKHVSGGTREYEDVAGACPAGLWKRWLNFSRAVIDYEFRLLLIAVYLLIIGPFALAFRFLLRDPAVSDTSSTWTARNESPSLDGSRRSF